MTPHSSTREKIIKAVETLLIKGEQNFSMAKIAEEVGITKSSLYYFFPSKKELFKEVMFYLFSSCEAEINDVMIDPKIEADQKLLMFIEGMSCMMSKESTLIHFVFRQMFDSVQSQELLETMYDKREEKKEFVMSILEKGINDGVFRKQDTYMSAEIIISMMDFYALQSAFPNLSHKIKHTNSQINNHLIFLLKP